MKNIEMDIVFILDRSGSMSGIESDTIGGYNSYIANQKDKNVLVTTVLFDDQYEMINNRKHISEVNKLTNKEYFVRGSTALLDAIGNTIKFMDKSINKKVIFIITTDGYENASREYNKEQIKELIKGHSKWEFIYVGANIDSYEEGRKLGIKDQNISNYKKDKIGVSKLYDSIERASNMMYNESSIKDNWKDELEDYIKENKE